MPVLKFPDPRHSTPEGIVAFGGNLDPENLIQAYRMGIFPWPIQGLPLAWFCPPERAILDWGSLHVPRSLARARNKGIYRFTIDQAFERVIAFCSSVLRPEQDGTWINPDIVRAYTQFYKMGYAHSIEVWRDQCLVGGIYGVEVEGVFTGESMFHLESNTSKLAILYLMEYLHSQGSHWMDIQVMTPHMEALGARLISRDEFLSQLAKSQKNSLKLF